MTYRNKKILAAAKDAPCLVPGCGRDDGTTVAMHSNQIRDGKGMGEKAADYRVAFGCAACHDLIDGRVTGPSGHERIEMWEAAHRATVAYLFENGVVK